MPEARKRTAEEAVDGGEEKADEQAAPQRKYRRVYTVNFSQCRANITTYTVTRHDVARPE